METALNQASVIAETEAAFFRWLTNKRDVDGISYQLWYLKLGHVTFDSNRLKLTYPTGLSEMHRLAINGR